MKNFQEISEHGIFRGIWNMAFSNYMKYKKNKCLFTIEWE